MSENNAHPQQSPLPSTTELFGFSAGPLETNCYVLVDRADTPEGKPAPATIIDPGYGAAQTLKDLAKQRTFFVNKIVLTHGHIDHIRDAGELAVPVSIHKLDEPLVVNDLRGTPLSDLFDVENMVQPHSIEHLGDSVDMGGVNWDVHHMPGHSPGHVMFRINGLIIGGDVLFRGGVGRTDLPFSSPEDMLLTLKRLSVEFDDDDVVLPGHGPQTTIGQEKATNPFLQ